MNKLGPKERFFGIPTGLNPMVDWKRQVRQKLHGLSLSPAREADIVEELAQHLEDRYRELIVAGATDVEASAATKAELDKSLTRELLQIEFQGSKTEIVLGSGGRNLMGSIVQDFRYGVRMLAKTRGFTAIAILMLALGIGANTAIFQLIDTVRLRALPVNHPEELADIHIVDMVGARGNFWASNPSVTNPIWEQIRDNQQAFTDVFAWGGARFNLSTSGEARYAEALWVSGNFFDALGVRPMLGRVFASADDRPGCGISGAVISYSFWQREFGGDPGVIGRKVTVDFQPVDVIGVTPRSFTGLEVGRSFDIALPICSEPSVEGAQSKLASGTDWWLTIMGRMKPEWSLEQASAHLEAISPGIFRTSLPPNYPPVSVKNYLAFRLAAFPAGRGFSRLRDNYSASLNLILAIAALVLLIACANLANLMLARASARGREVSIRLALGASRRRLIQQVLAESLLLAVAGAGLGVILAGRLSRFLAAMLLTDDNLTSMDLSPDWRVLGFATLLAVATCVVFGLVPAFSGARGSPAEALKTGGRGMTAGGRRLRLHKALVVVQVALSLVLVVQALLFSRNLQRLMSVDAGFQQDGILVTFVDLSKANVPEARRSAFKQELISKLRGVPGIDGVAQSSIVPVSGDSSGNAIWMDGTDQSGGRETSLATISDGYFSTMKSSMLGGRDFDGSDTASSTKTAIVNEAFARQFTDGTNPVGRRFWIEPTPTTPATLYDIVGLVRNSKYQSLSQDFQPIAFLPASQEPHPHASAQLMIRTSAPFSTVIGPIKDVVSQLAPSGLIDFNVLREEILDSLLSERLLALLSGFFGILALMLACLGLYGIVSYGVANRTGEIGIRLALGSTRGGIVGMIMRETAAVVLIGLGAGIALAIAAGLVVRSMLFGLSATDPVTFAVAIAAIVITGLAAAFIPARRAAGVDPMIALRYE
jgi:putative ABC transport system permease protein